MALQWGIASSGLIANDFVTALKGLSSRCCGSSVFSKFGFPSGKNTDDAIFSLLHDVYLNINRGGAVRTIFCDFSKAVDCVDIKNAEKFAKTHDIPNFHEGYLNLAKNDVVQVVYIGVLNPQHCEVATMMLEHGKHVLCEKPFTLNEKQTRKVIDLARRKNLFVMEAVWSRFFPVYKKVREILDSGVIGEVKYASVDFGFPIEQVDRIKQKDLGGSAILDLGVYVLQFQQFVFKGLKPEQLIAAGHINEEGVDVTASAIFTYPDKKTAVVTCNATVRMSNEAVIVGTKGTIKIPHFWAPVSYKLNEKLEEIPLIKNNAKFNYSNSAGLAYQAVEVRNRILEGNIESDVMPHEETIQLAAWMDTLRRQIGVEFLADLE